MAPKILLVKDTDFGTADRTRDFSGKLQEAVRQKGLGENVSIVRAADVGIYGQGIIVRIWPEDITYSQIQDMDIERLIHETIVENRVMEDKIYQGRPYQLRIVLRNCGRIDPESLEDYISAGGYQGLRKILSGWSSEEIIDEIKKSGLRGRGGAGYPTWLKWNLTRSVQAEEKFVVCNGDEGDPGAYMDRSILESDPHSVLEGMIIAARAVGARRGFFYIRAEYPLAVDRVRKAIDQGYRTGLLGRNILDSDFSFEADVRLGAGAFVCGEETALLSSIEGKRGYPRPRPPYPSVKGLWDKPTVINNVETLANVPYIISRGGDEFARIGTATSKGTKVFAVTGKVKNSGLVEVPMGTTLRQVIYDTCGGTGSGKEVKAVQTGGPSGGVIPASLLDTPVDYENLQKLGSIMGSGGMIVMDTDDCMVDIAKFYQKFCVDESCGKCAPCRIGTTQMLRILSDISEGKGRLEDLPLIRKTSVCMQKASLCGLGQSASNPAVSTLRYFEDEYRAHILEKRCPAGKCRALANYNINPDKCRRCGVCAKNCPAGAITGSREAGYLISTEKCTRCGNCLEVCKFRAVERA